MKKLTLIIALVGILAFGALPALADTPRALEGIDSFDVAVISDAQAQDIRGTFPLGYAVWLAFNGGITEFLADPGLTARYYGLHVWNSNGGFFLCTSLEGRIPDVIYYPLFCGEGLLHYLRSLMN